MPLKVSVHQLQQAGKVTGFCWAFFPLLPLPPGRMFSLELNRNGVWSSKSQLSHQLRGRLGNRGTERDCWKQNRNEGAELGT